MNQEKSKCPICKGKLILRTNSKTKQKFWGCSGYPKCTFTRGIKVSQNSGITIYVLKQKLGKYYIGKSTNPEKRIKDHFEGHGCNWTTKYLPISVVSRIENCDSFDEDKIVKMYMSEHGIDNVRGGSYSQIYLTETVKHQLQREIWGAKDLCFLCGGDHFADMCTSKQPSCFLIVFRRWLGF